MKNFLSDKEKLQAELLYIFEIKIPNEYPDVYRYLIDDRYLYKFTGNQRNEHFTFDKDKLNDNIEELERLRDYIITLTTIFSNEKLKKEYLERKQKEKEAREKEFDYYMTNNNSLYGIIQRISKALLKYNKKKNINKCLK